MTRKEKFFEIFPNASSYDEIPTISPCELDTKFESGYCQDDMCRMCREWFWNGKMKDGNFFAQFIGDGAFSAISFLEIFRRISSKFYFCQIFHHTKLLPHYYTKLLPH